jgi:hypothetical protein|tara:strand:+ start:199 stop:429 length:231 start_codon:yes stop_codon:yes gene_type:complete
MPRPSNNQQINRNQVNKIRARESVISKQIKKLMGKEAVLASKLNEVQDQIELLRKEGSYMYNHKQRLLKKLQNNNK